MTAHGDAKGRQPGDPYYGEWCVRSTTEAGLLAEAAAEADKWGRCPLVSLCAPARAA